ncbi:MAG: hypothetical protein PHU85_13395, partial [Phycisphaerae bacterium]|nr:hypothetical protein [Phycisphaerae bacterium]
GDLLKTDFDAKLTLKLPETTQPDAEKKIERSVAARKLLEQSGGDAAAWLRGPVCTEWLLDGLLAGADGQLDQDLAVQFQVRAYAGCKTVRVSVVVENCWDTWAGHIAYDAAITLGKDAKPAYERKDLLHRRLARWRKVLWTGTPAVEPVIVHDFAYMSDTGALPNYDRSIVTPEETLAALGQAAAGREFEPTGSGSLTKYMPTTGGRAEIGPYPQWTVRYLLTMDPRAKSLVLANGDLAGSWPIHVRSSKTKRILTLDERPNFWFGSRRPGEDGPKWQPDRTAPPPPDSPAGKANALTPDVAHQGSFAYVPYLVTGDFYYLEEAYFWANHVLLSQWNVPRQAARGIMCDQIRGNAWGLRNIADAASIAADGDPEANYFDQRIRNNIDYLAGKMLGPPEYNAMGFWGIRTVDDARIDKPANPKWVLMVPWEHDYLIWSLHHLVELGWSDAAKARDFEMRWRVGMFVNPAFDVRLAAPYRFVVGELGADRKVAFYTDWKKLSDENLRLTPKPGLATYGGSYSYSARMAVVCGVDGGFPKSDDALKRIEELLPDWQKQLSKDPTFAITPRKGTEHGQPRSRPDAE